jgi:hypothetical protein
MLHRRQVGKQRIGVNRVGVLLVAGKEEQRLAVKARRQIFAAELDNVGSLRCLYVTHSPAECIVIDFVYTHSVAAHATIIK